MLRIGFLPSDYNPMVLMLGEIEDMRLLAGVLRRFAREQTDLRLDEQGFCTAVRTACPNGLRGNSLRNGKLVLRLAARPPALDGPRSSGSCCRIASSGGASRRRAVGPASAYCVRPAARRPR